jgi:hypothetical protein
VLRPLGPAPGQQQQAAGQEQQQEERRVALLGLHHITGPAGDLMAPLLK